MLAWEGYHCALCACFTWQCKPWWPLCSLYCFRRRSECFRMLQIASEGFRLHQKALECVRMLQNASEYFRLQQNASERIRRLQNASECFTIATECVRMSEGSPARGEKAPLAVHFVRVILGTVRLGAVPLCTVYVLRLMVF